MITRNSGDFVWLKFVLVPARSVQWARKGSSTTFSSVGYGKIGHYLSPSTQV
jgi:hypothetical protein